MNFEGLSINIQPEHKQLWITLLSFENSNGIRSFFHLEYSRGNWKLQFLWLNRDCWLFFT